MPAAAPQAAPGTVIGTGSLIAPGGQSGLQGYTGAMGDGVPVGAVFAYTSLTPPPGCLLCDGSAVSRTLYSALFNVCGTIFGSGDGSTTFNLPDLRSRFIICSGQGIGLTLRQLGGTGGEENHVLVAGELASHTHGLGNHTHGMDHYHAWGAQGSHTHTYTYKNLETAGTGGVSGTSFANLSQTLNTGAANIPAGNTVYASQTNAAWASTVGPSTNTSDAAGSDTGHNNIPPYLSLVYMIKATAGSGPSNTAPIADTTQNGLLRQLSGATTDYVGGDNTCHPVPQAGASAGFISKSAAYTLLSTDSGKYILCTGNGWTLTLPIASATLCFHVRNDQGFVANGTITIAPQTGSTIDGLSSINILPGQECTILSDGTNWRTFELKREVVLGTQDITTAVANGIIRLPAGYRLFDLEWTGLCSSVAGPAALFGVFSTDGGNTWISTNYYYGYFYLSAATTVAGGSGSAIGNAYFGWSIDTAARGHVKTSLCPGGLGRNPSWQSSSSGYNQTGGYAGRMTVSGFYNGGIIVNALQYYFNSGNITQSFLTVKGVV